MKAAALSVFASDAPANPKQSSVRAADDSKKAWAHSSNTDRSNTHRAATVTVAAAAVTIIPARFVSVSTTYRR
jgi:hypothetical protein